MTLLLDSHAVLWWIRGDRFDARARRRVARSDALVSAASVWELGIKVANGKLRLERTLSEEIELHDFGPLAVSVAHAERAGQLPRHHADPFDRMLVAQAQVEQLTIVTRDPVFDAYDVDVLRC